MTADQWTRWAGRRPAARVLHLDSAAASRQSTGTLAAVRAHVRLETEIGAYVAQEQAAETLDALRAAIATLFGLGPDCVAFTESATAALDLLLGVWPLPEGARVGVLAVEWGPNLEAFAHRGLQITALDADTAGRLELSAFESRLAHDPPDIVHLTQVTSHRGVVQPVAEAARMCRAAGVALWVDAAQAIGHVETACGADAVYATSRKWLTGPRGIGMLAVAADRQDMLRVRHSALLGDDVPPVAHLESHEAHIAGRVGLANAVAEYLAAGPHDVIGRLGEVGRMTRRALHEVPGWTVVGAHDAPCAITAIRPTAGQDVAATRARLLAEHMILTTAGSAARAPRDVPEPLLRVSPHVDCTAEALERLCAALGRS